jgi:hypothetical protein
MRELSAVLLMLDGRSLRVRVADPPPPTFALAQHPGPSRLFVFESQTGLSVTYREPDRRKVTMPVELDRRRGRGAPTPAGI